MDNLTKNILLIWLFIVSMTIVVPSVIILFKVNYNTASKSPKFDGNFQDLDDLLQLSKDKGKDTLTIRNISLFDKISNYELNRFDKSTNSFKEKVVLWKHEADLRNRYDINSIYSLVVKDTLLQLITNVLTAAAAVLFVNKGSEALSNYFNKRSNNK